MKKWPLGLHSGSQFFRTFFHPCQPSKMMPRIPKKKSVEEMERAKIMEKVRQKQTYIIQRLLYTALQYLEELSFICGLCASSWCLGCVLMLCFSNEKLRVNRVSSTYKKTEFLLL